MSTLAWMAFGLGGVVGFAAGAVWVSITKKFDSKDENE